MAPREHRCPEQNPGGHAAAGTCQVDNPRALYNMPKTRFVAGFIGRTNFIEGVSDGQQISFDGFALPHAAFERDVPSAGKAVFSVRPHSMRLSDGPPAVGATSVGVVVMERAFLGQHWDYVVRPREGVRPLSELQVEPVRMRTSSHT